MPGYADKFTDEQLRDLANYLRVTWSPQPGDLTLNTISDLKEVIFEHD